MPAATGGVTLIRNDAYWEKREAIHAACRGDFAEEQRLIDLLHEEEVERASSSSNSGNHRGGKLYRSRSDWESSLKEGIGDSGPGGNLDR